MRFFTWQHSPFIILSHFSYQNVITFCLTYRGALTFKVRLSLLLVINCNFPAYSDDDMNYPATGGAARAIGGYLPTMCAAAYRRLDEEEEFIDELSSSTDGKFSSSGFVLSLIICHIKIYEWKRRCVCLHHVLSIVVNFTT